ncbi:hypothetical protein ACS0TY_001019 [Phlomoides rotata]
MSFSAAGSFNQFENYSFDDGYVAPESFSNFGSTAADFPPPIYVSGGEIPADPAYFSSGTFDNGPILPRAAGMEPEEGYALREWRRENAIRLEEKEKREKELLRQIIGEAEEYKVEFQRKIQIKCETNRASTREKEIVFIANHERFHAEAAQDYWKSIAELIPKEVPKIEKRKGRKEQDKKQLIAVVQGPKPGKPTDQSRMRQILLKLKHNTPPHLKHSPPAPEATTSGTAVTVA